MPPLGFRIDTLEVELLPHGFHQLVDIPAMFGADGDGIGDAVKKIKFFNRNGVDFVQAVYHGNVTDFILSVFVSRRICGLDFLDNNTSS